MCVCVCVRVREVGKTHISSYLSCRKLSKYYIHTHCAEPYKEMFAAQQNTGSRKKYFNLVQNVLATPSITPPAASLIEDMASTN